MTGGQIQDSAKASGSLMREQVETADDLLFYANLDSDDPYANVTTLEAMEDMERAMFADLRGKVKSRGGEEGEEGEEGKEGEEVESGGKEESYPTIEQVIKEAGESECALSAHSLEVAFSQLVTSEIQQDALDCWPMIAYSIQQNGRIQRTATCTLNDDETQHIVLTVDDEGWFHAPGYHGSIARNMLDKIIIAGAIVVQKWFLVFALCFACNEELRKELKAIHAQGHLSYPILTPDAFKRISKPYDHALHKNGIGVYTFTEPTKVDPRSYGGQTSASFYMRLKGHYYQTCNKTFAAAREVYNFSTFLFSIIVSRYNEPSAVRLLTLNPISDLQVLLPSKVKIEAKGLEVPLHRTIPYAAESLILLLGQLSDNKFGLNRNVIDNRAVGRWRAILTAGDIWSFWERMFEQVTGKLTGMPKKIPPFFTLKGKGYDNRHKREHTAEFKAWALDLLPQVSAVTVYFLLTFKIWKPLTEACQEDMPIEKPHFAGGKQFQNTQTQLKRQRKEANRSLEANEEFIQAMAAAKNGCEANPDLFEDFEEFYAQRWSLKGLFPEGAT